MFSLRVSPTTRPHLPPSLAPVLRRYRHLKAHRSIQVQLLADVPGLGQTGTVQTVAPGYMRNILYPYKKARYLVQGPKILDRAYSPQDTSLDELNTMAQQLINLPEIAFERPARPRPFSPTTSESLLYRPISLSDVAKHLSDAYGYTRLQPPDAVFSIVGKPATVAGLRSTGTHAIHVTLRSGQVIPLTVLIRRKGRSQDAEQDQGLALATEDQASSRTLVAPS
ncbi:hypothetical protein SISNIDRAFT_341017 [Sistotremastrum niveocremeum HHB9708]|uniref:Ribosomal protein L9 domain-containing protein n=2 Tax=Sistotremastraceae TaxID=3402574 RepID=A0A164XQN4_9AGAM|nr:hypothetical protein SISNIDRAFT_341017 [Sistotremastrum niveocremeum HHB9708]KZT44463.1 hypothetical protein SISSUDRAFT_19489 [Sistotremastrum suecicum HHB10207 ss-3]